MRGGDTLIVGRHSTPRDAPFAIDANGADAKATKPWRQETWRCRDQQGQTECLVGQSREVQRESGPVTPPSTGWSSCVLRRRSVSRWIVSFDSLNAFFLSLTPWRGASGRDWPAGFHLRMVPGKLRGGRCPPLCRLISSRVRWLQGFISDLYPTTSSASLQCPVWFLITRPPASRN